MINAIIALFFAGAAVVAPLVAGGAPAKMPSVNDPAVHAAIVAAVEKDRKAYGGRTPVPGVLVGVFDDAGNSYVHGFGYADVAKRRAMSAADHFRIGSNTKTFVVGVILQLVDEKKLSLDDPLGKFSLGVTVPNAKNITVREMCNMRSGLFEGYDTPQMNELTAKPGMTFDPRTIITWASQQKPYFAANKGYHYSNTNYLLLGLIIENVTHDGVGSEIQKRLLVPFGLKQTSYPTTMAMPDPWARGYGLDKKRNWEDVSNTIPVSLMGSAGEMISDMDDMKRWIKLYTTGKVSGAATYRALMQCIPTGQGDLAFGLALGCSAGWYGYTGGLPGYNTANYYFPKTGVTVVAWVDAQRNDPDPGVANAMFRDIAAILTPDNRPFSKIGKGL
jgi:D-alanyl-D-alanine carboxypeptidase